MSSGHAQQRDGEIAKRGHDLSSGATTDAGSFLECHVVEETERGYGGAELRPIAGNAGPGADSFVLGLSGDRLQFNDQECNTFHAVQSNPFLANRRGYPLLVSDFPWLAAVLG